jgi:hypothetical protein
VPERRARFVFDRRAHGAAPLPGGGRPPSLVHDRVPGSGARRERARGECRRGDRGAVAPRDAERGRARAGPAGSRAHAGRALSLRRGLLPVARDAAGRGGRA